MAARTCKKIVQVKLLLVSVGKLCTNGMLVLFDANSVNVFNQQTRQIVAQGKRDIRSNIYMIPVADAGAQGVKGFTPTGTDAAQGVIPQNTFANNVYEIRVVPALISYLHACTGFSPKLTWIRAIEAEFFTTWPGLTADRVRQYLGKLETTTMGHQRMIHQNIQPTNKGTRSRVHDVCVTMTDDDDMRNMIAMDLPGRYPVTSASGNKYIFVMINYDSNYIKALPMKSRKTSEMIQCYRGFTSRLIQLDNEVSKKLVEKIQEDKLEYQLSAPGDHRQNPAERAIQSFKNHFISIRSGTDDKYPRNRWDLLIEQAEITLNMLRSPTLNPKVSAYTLINGVFDFNKTPIAPCGMKTIVHNMTSERASWADHGSRGFNIGPAMNHFRCYKNLMVTSKSVQVSNTVEFFPSQCNNPQLSEGEQINLLL